MRTQDMPATLADALDQGVPGWATELAAALADTPATLADALDQCVLDGATSLAVALDQCVPGWATTLAAALGQYGALGRRRRACGDLG